MHDARLDDRFREDRLNRVREAFEAIDAADQDVLDAAVLEVGQHLHPKLGALGLLKPHPQHLALTVHGDRHRQVAGLALHRPAVADLEHQRVEEHDGVDVLQRA